MRKRVLFLSALVICAFQGKSQMKTTENVLPLFGNKAREKGITLPKALGISVNYFHQKMDMDLESIGLFVEGSEADPIIYDQDALDIKQSQAISNTISFRPDVWVFPFLNVYGILGKTYAQSDVMVDLKLSPMSVNTHPKPEGSTFGFGCLIAGKAGPLWFNADISFAWVNLDILTEPTKVQNLSIRSGHKMFLDKREKHSVSFWAGATAQYFNSETIGKYSLHEISGGDPQKALGIMAILDGVDIQNPKEMMEYAQKHPKPLNENLGYSIQKGLKHPWSMCVGFQYEFNQRWAARWEQGFLGDRVSSMASVGYRFGV